MIIQGGTGNGYAAGVNSDNMLLARVVQESVEHHVNHDHGRAYQVTFSQSPTAANDCFYWLKNTDEDRDIIIEGVELGFKNATAVDVEVYLKIGDTGTANVPTTVTPANLNSESALTCTCTSQKGADLDNAGAGIAGGTEFCRWLFPLQDEKSAYHNFSADLVLAPSGAMSIWASDAGATYYVNMNLWVYDR